MEGGVIEKGTDGAPTGYMEEADFVSRLQQVPMPGADKLLDAFEKAPGDVFFPRHRHRSGGTSSQGTSGRFIRR